MRDADSEGPEHVQGIGTGQKLVQHLTGIDKLDDILGGGLPKEHIVLLAGDSGTGKTTLGMEWLIRGSRQYGEKGIYFTLTESVTDATRNLHTFDFADEETDGVQFVDLRSTLKLLEMNEREWGKGDIDEFVETVRDILDEGDIDRVVIDSITALAYSLDDKKQIRRLIFRLGNVLKSQGVTTLLTSEISDGGYSRYEVEEFISDGIIKLSQERRHGHLVRTLEVAKMRGIDYDSHIVDFEITGSGINLIPGVVEMDYPAGDTRLKTGIPELDEMVEGGIWDHSANLVTGPAGSGKTTMALQFLDQCRQDDRSCLYVSFEESQDELMKKAEHFGLQIDPEEDGTHMLSIDPAAGNPRQHLARIRELVQEHDVEVAVVDSLTAIRHTTDEDAFDRFAKDLVFTMKAEEITSLFTSSYQNLIGIESMSNSGISSFADNVFMQNVVEVNGKLENTIIVWKTRNSDHDTRIRRYEIGKDGISIGQPMTDFRGLATGTVKIANRDLENISSDVIGDDDD